MTFLHKSLHACTYRDDYTVRVRQMTDIDSKLTCSQRQETVILPFTATAVYYIAAVLTFCHSE